MRARLALLALPCIAVALSSAAASAQTAPAPATQPGAPSATDARALAEMLFFTARGLMEAGRYAEACGKLSESYRLDPAPGTLLNLAVCNEKIGKTASAWGEFRDSVAEARRTNRADREKLALEHIAALEPELSYLIISVPPAVRGIRGLEITRNGIPLTSAAWDTDLPVDPGDVEVIEKAPLYKPKTLHVTVAAKQHATLAAVPLELAPIERPPPPYWTGKRTAGLLILTGAVAAAAFGGFIGAQAINERKNSDAQCPTDVFGRRCTQAGVDYMNKASTDAILSDVGFGVSAVAAGLGAFFLFTGGAHEQPPPAAAGIANGTGWSWDVGGSPRGVTGTLTRSF